MALPAGMLVEGILREELRSAGTAGDGLTTFCLVPGKHVVQGELLATPLTRVLLFCMDSLVVLGEGEHTRSAILIQTRHKNGSRQ